MSLTKGSPSHFDMDDAFCIRMCDAIAAGLENAPIGVVTTPGTKNPKYVPEKPFPLLSLAARYRACLNRSAATARLCPRSRPNGKFIAPSRDRPARSSV